MTTVRYWDQLGMSTQAVIREAKRQLENVELEPETVIAARRALLKSTAYDCCEHVRYDIARRKAG